MATDINLITDIQKQQGRVRNVCVLAHVDHGKTTLSDHLIASNGLIHPRLAGELRYLDSLPEEQERGITMKSSSISLLHVPTPQCRSSEEGGEAAEISAQDGGSQDSGNSDEGSKRRARGVLINLIDSPGHVDFCSEVSTAVRLSDGALVVVDAVEGVCIQTHAVLRQAWQERVCMCLVVNKVDRLVLELGLEAQEACRRLRAIVAHVNMIVSGFRSEQFLSEADAIVESDLQAVDMERRASAGEDQARGADEEEEEEETFSPLKNNVVFASAGDGWAFRPSFFADLWAGKLQCSPAALERALWGDYAINAKTRRVGAAKPGQKTVFASLALEPIFKIYGVLDSASQQASLDAEAAGAELARMVASLGLQHRIPARSLLGEPRARVRAVLQAWLPLSHAVLDMVVDSLPSPRRAAPLRVPRMLGGEGEGGEEGGKEAAIRALAASDSGASAPTTVYVSKMVAVPLSSFPEERHAAADAEDFLAFGRVFSGVVREGQELWVLHGSEPAAAKERLEEDVGGAEEVLEEEEVDEAEEVNEAEGRAAEKAENAFVAPTSTPPPPSALKKIAARVRPTGLYVMMGRSLERVSEVPAGSVLALRGLGEAILKSATLSSSPAGPALAPARHQTQPILRVGVEPRDARELPRLLQGLRLLQRADPMARVELMPSGECVLCTAGEVHLQTCVEHLRRRFARCELVVSQPLVGLRESVADEAEEEGLGEGEGGEEARSGEGEAKDSTLSHSSVSARGAVVYTPTQSVQIQVQVRPLPAKVAQAIQAGAAAADGTDAGARRLWGRRLLALCEGRAEAEEALRSAWELSASGGVLLCPAQAEGEDDGDLEPVPLTDLAGSRALGLLDSEAASLVSAKKLASATSLASAASLTSAANLASAKNLASANNLALAENLASASQTLFDDSQTLEAVRAGVRSGFRLACAAGPLCQEPLWGLFVRLRASRLSGRPAEEGVYGPLSGQVASATASAIRRAVLAARPRVVEQQLLCEITTSTEGLAASYAVLGRRRARVLKEELREGSGVFVVRAVLPTEASFGLADDLRRRSSGGAAAALMLAHWERLAEDPFFVPVTLAQREEWGEEGQGVGAKSVARRLIDDCRRRKGLPVQEKVIESATKQRTRAKKV